MIRVKLLEFSRLLSHSTRTDNSVGSLLYVCNPIINVNFYIKLGFIRTTRRVAAFPSPSLDFVDGGLLADRKCGRGMVWSRVKQQRQQYRRRAFRTISIFYPLIPWSSACLFRVWIPRLAVPVQFLFRFSRSTFSLSKRDVMVAN